MNNNLDLQSKILWTLQQLLELERTNTGGASTNVNVTNNPLPVSLTGGNVSITGPVTVSNEVEVKNDIGNPIPVNVTSSVLPTGAAQEHTTANSYHSTRLTDGTNFYDARVIRQLTSSDIVTISNTSFNTTNNDNRYVHYLALTKEDTEQCIIRYAYDLNGILIGVDVLDMNYNVTGAGLNIASLHNDAVLTTSYSSSNSNNSDNLINAGDFIEYTILDTTFKVGYLTAFVTGNNTEEVFFTLLGDNVTNNIKQALRYETVYHYDSVLNRTYYTFMFNTLKCYNLRLELKSNSVNGGFNQVKLLLSSNDISIDNNMISAEDKQINVSDISSTYNTHLFLDKDYTEHQYTKSIAASLLSNGDTIPTQLSNINASIQQSNQSTSSFHPNPINYTIENEFTNLLIDSTGNLQTRSSIITDEGSFRYDFEGTSLYTNLTGTLSFNGVNVNGTGTLFLTELGVGQYIKLQADANSSVRRIVEIINNTQLILESAYPTISSGLSHSTYIKYNLVGGSTIAYNNSTATLSSSTAITNAAEISKFIDYSPLSINVRLSQTQRLATQTTQISLQEPNTGNPKWFARFSLTGTTNTALVCETAGIKNGIVTASDIETTNVTVPSGLTTQSNLIYRIEVKTRGVLFYINDILVATHTVHIPGQYDLLEFKTIIANTGASTNTDVNIDYINFNNINEISIYNPSNNEGFVANNAPVLNYSGSASANNTDLVLIDCNQIRSLFVKFSGTFNATVTFQGDNDANFTNPVAVQAIPAAGGTIVTTTNVTGAMFNIPVTTRYIRFRTTTYTSGTVIVSVNALQQESAQAIVSVGNTVPVTQSGAWTVTPTPSTSQGFNLARSFTSAATTNATLVKNSAAVISNITLINTSSSTAYLKLYNKATTPIPGTDVPFITYPLPGTAALAPTIVFNLELAMGMRLSSGLGYAITRNFSPLDTTVIGANEIQGNILYI